MLVLVLTSLIAQLEAFMFIKLYGLHSLMKRCKCRYQQTQQVCCRWSAMAVFNRGCIVGHIPREIIILMHGSIFNWTMYFGTQHLNEPRHVFHSCCCSIWYVFELMHLYEPGFNKDKHSNYKNYDGEAPDPLPPPPPST